LTACWSACHNGRSARNRFGRHSVAGLDPGGGACGTLTIEEWWGARRSV
jgi:hypothetical protein